MKGRAIRRDIRELPYEEQQRWVGDGVLAFVLVNMVIHLICARVVKLLESL